MPTFRLSALLFGGALLALSGCSTDSAPTPDADEVLFQDGSDDELVLAEDLAYEHLFSAADGPALGRGITEFRTLKVSVDPVGMAHAKVQQLYRGVPVWGGEAIVHLTRNGKLAHMTDALLSGLQLDATPDYSADEAIDLAVEGVPDGWEAFDRDPVADLWVLRHEGVDHLVYRVQLSRLDGTADDTMPVVFIDAHTGETVWAYENLQTATCSGTTNYYGTVDVDCNLYGGSYYLEDTTELLGTYSYKGGTRTVYDVSTTSGTFDTSTYTKNAVEAHYAVQATYSYYNSNFGRDGIDGAGGPRSKSSHGYTFVTSVASYSRSYVNAYWDGTKMVYGDGDGVNSNSLTTLDIAGHELTHGVTEYEANLTYSGESGGLNESYSDVFGAMVERSMEGESANTWLVGEAAWTPSVSGDALRYMADPAADGYSKDYYSSTIGSTDVHYSSGLSNLAFYLLSEGGTHPRGKSSTVVTGIGADDAADIWYLALTSYLTSSSNFAAARAATLSAASELYGSSSTQYEQVGNAWAAVGVGSAGGGGGSSTCTTSSYTGSLSRKGKTGYAPSSSGTAVSASSQTVSLTGPSSADFDLYLDVLSGSTWTAVASSTGSTSTESISYSGSTGTYRVRAYSYSGSGSYSVSWCK